jgi:DNA-binding transcriptional LysR family regulator
MIQLHRLEGFYRVAQARGYARAARQFPYPITQPAVHQQVRKLEKDLGARLFERIAKDQLRLTAAGRTLYEFCAPFFEELPAVVRSIEAMAFGGELRIDASGLALRQLLPGWIKRLRKARSDIQVDLQEIETPDLDRLRTGAADLIVDHLPEVPADVNTRTVARAHIFLVLPADHKLASRKRLSLRDMQDEAFVSYHPSLPHHDMQMRELQRQDCSPERTVSASSADSILSFVQAGMGYSLVPWLDERGPRARGIVNRRLSGKANSLPIKAAWRASSAHPLVELALELAPANQSSSQRHSRESGDPA